MIHCFKSDLFTEKLKRFEWAVEIPGEAINLV